MGWGARLGSFARRLAGDTGGVDGVDLAGVAVGAGRKAWRPNEDSVEEVVAVVVVETGCGVSKVDGVAADGY